MAVSISVVGDGFLVLAPMRKGIAQRFKRCRIYLSVIVENSHAILYACTVRWSTEFSTMGRRAELTDLLPDLCVLMLVLLFDQVYYRLTSDIIVAEYALPRVHLKRVSYA